ARQAYPDVALCLLVEDNLPSAAMLFTSLGFEPEVLGPDFQLLSAAVVQSIRTGYPRLRLAPWTVNTIAELTTVLEWKTESITTDYPDRLLALLSNV
nr:hypothetical protein [Tanacetum cinerariifolium]